MCIAGMSRVKTQMRFLISKITQRRNLLFYPVDDRKVTRFSVETRTI